MSENKNQFVLPGDTISGSYEPAQNVILNDNRLLSTAIGFCEINDNEASVSPLTGFYIPRSDDLVIGKIKSHTSMVWEIDINSYHVGILPAFDIFGKDYNPSKHDLSSKLNIGDLVAVRIVSGDTARDPLVTISGENLGKIDSGELVKISPAKISYLISKHLCLIQTIESSTDTSITIGQNGLVIVSGGESNGLLKAIEAIQMVEEQAHLADLTDKVKKMLETNGD
jgi:exosome complex component RRP4